MSKNTLNTYRVGFLLELDAKEPFSFPEFMRHLRRAYGLSRKAVCDDLSIGVMTMFCIEMGCFKRMLSPKLIIVMAHYYDVSEALLAQKCLNYLASEEGMSRGDYKPKKPRSKDAIRRQPKI